MIAAAPNRVGMKGHGKDGTASSELKDLPRTTRIWTHQNFALTATECNGFTLLSATEPHHLVAFCHFVERPIGVIFLFGLEVACGAHRPLIVIGIYYHSGQVIGDGGYMVPPIHGIAHAGSISTREHLI